MTVIRLPVGGRAGGRTVDRHPMPKSERRRTVAIDVPWPTLCVLRLAARRRGVPIARLIQDLLIVIADDKLVNAVLDDGGRR